MKSDASRASESAPLPKFAVGDHIRAKAGVPDPDYPDIPLGGWTGSVVEVEAGKPFAYYLVRFNRRTLSQIHPVYRNRCERDGLILDKMTLSEEDLESDIGELARIEQAKNIIARPLSTHDRDDRVRAVFSLTSDDLLPDVGKKSLLMYCKYLTGKLTFPFKGKYLGKTGPLHDRTSIVTVFALIDPEDCPAEGPGLFCEARHDKRKIQLPLLKLVVGKRSPNRQLLDDYSYWSGNCP